MNLNRKRIWRLLLGTVTIMPAILPVACSKTLLQGLTPFLIDGSSSLMHDVLFFAAPFVLP